MWSILKQNSVVFSKKIFLVFSLFLNIVIISTVATTSFSLINSINNSSNDINVKGNAANLIMDNVEIPSSKNVYALKKTKPLEEQKKSININGINMDKYYQNPNDPSIKRTDLVLFPYTQKQLDRKPAIDPKKMETYVDLPVGVIYKNALSFGGNKYAIGINLFNYDTKTVNFDFRDVIFDENNNMIGIWNEGSYRDQVSIKSTMYKYSNNSGPNDNQDVFSLIKTPEQKNDLTIVKTTWSGLSAQAIRNRLYFFHVPSPSNILYNYMLNLPKEKPLNEFIPYQSTEINYGFEYEFTNRQSNIENFFIEYLKTITIDNEDSMAFTYSAAQEILKPTLWLNEYKITRLSDGQFEKQSEESKKNIISNFNKSLEKWKEQLEINFSNMFNQFVSRIIINGLEFSDILYAIENEFFFKDENSSEFIVSNKSWDTVNKIIVQDGKIDLTKERKLDILKSFSEYDKKYPDQLSLKSFKNFLLFFSQKNWKGGPTYKDSKVITDELIKKINENPSWDIKQVTESAEYYQWYLNLYIKVYNNFNIDIRVKFGAYLTDLSPAQQIKSFVFIENWIIAMDYSYYKKNNKKVIPNKSFTYTFNNGSKIEIFSEKDLIKKIEEGLNLEEYISSLPKEYIFSFNKDLFLIGASAMAPNFLYPIVNATSPIPNTLKQGVIYLNNNQFGIIKSNIKNTSNNTYFSLKYNKWSNVEIFKSFLLDKLGEDDFLSLYSPMDVNVNNPIRTLRYVLPEKIKEIIIISSFLLTLILFIFSSYLLFLLIKMMVNKLLISFSIAKANGISNISIIISTIIPILTFSIISSIVGYIITFLINASVLSFFNTIWFAPIVPLGFSPLLFFMSIFIITILISLIITVVMKIKLKKPILEMMNNSEEVKVRGVSKVLRGNTLNFPSIWKLRFGFLFNKFGKIIITCLMISISFGLSVSTFSLVSNISNSKIDYNNIYKYSYSYDLLTPQEQTGLYKTQEPYALGTSDDTVGIQSIYEVLNKEDPYSVLFNNAATKDLFAIRDIKGNVIIPKKYFSNIVLPSYNIYQRVSGKEINVLFNSSVSIFLLDIVVNGIGNIYNDFVKPTFDPNLAYSIERNLDIFKEEILKSKLGSEFKNFIKNKNGIPIHPIELDNKKVIKGIVPNEIRYNNEYLKFLGKLFGNADLMKYDNKISNNILPVDKECDEVYTYVKSNLIEKDNMPIKLLGIKNESKFIKLLNSSNKNISFKKEDYPWYFKDGIDNIGEDEECLVVNVGAAEKYNLYKGQVLEFDIKSDYYNTTENFARNISENNNIEFNEEPIIKKFRIVDISVDSFDSKFYIEQNIANKITRLDQGDFIQSIDLNIKSSITDNLIKRIKPSENYIPFNGIFSFSQEPIIANTIFPLTSLTGLYSIDFKLTSLQKNQISINLYSQLYTTFKNKYIYEEMTKKIIDNDFLTLEQQRELMSIFINTYKNSNNVYKAEEKIIGEYNMSLAFNAIDSPQIAEKLFDTTNNLVKVLQMLILSIFFPILFVVLIAVLLSIIDELKKTLLMMKVLGFSEGRIIRSILYLFLPPSLIALGIGSIILFSITTIAKKFLFSFTNILVSSNPNFIAFGIGFGVIVLLVLISGIISTIILKISSGKKAIINY